MEGTTSQSSHQEISNGSAQLCIGVRLLNVNYQRPPKVILENSNQIEKQRSTCSHVPVMAGEKGHHKNRREDQKWRPMNGHDF